MDTLFKQPKTIIYNKSPRKRQSTSPLSTPEHSFPAHVNKKSTSSLSSSSLVRRSPRKQEGFSRLPENCSEASVSSQNRSLKRQPSSSEDISLLNKKSNSNTQSRFRLRSPRKRLALSSDFGSDECDSNLSLHKRSNDNLNGESLVRRSPRESLCNVDAEGDGILFSYLIN